jgi:hypothetical protein
MALSTGEMPAAPNVLRISVGQQALAADSPVASFFSKLHGRAAEARRYVASLIMRPTPKQSSQRYRIRVTLEQAACLLLLLTALSSSPITNRNRHCRNGVEVPGFAESWRLGSRAKMRAKEGGKIRKESL